MFTLHRKVDRLSRDSCAVPLLPCGAPMNWLAHLRLAPAEPLGRLGNLCGDFVRGIDLATLHPRLREGVAQHRAIDAFVDAHPVVRGSRRRLDEPFRRFAGRQAPRFRGVAPAWAGGVRWTRPGGTGWATTPARSDDVAGTDHRGESGTDGAVDSAVGVAGRP